MSTMIELPEVVNGIETAELINVSLNHVGSSISFYHFTAKILFLFVH